MSQKKRGRKSRKNKQNRKTGEDKHHVYPARDARHKEEIKVIDSEAHRRWHCLVMDMTPEEAISYIAQNFMPTNLEHKLQKAIK